MDMGNYESLQHIRLGEIIPFIEDMNVKTGEIYYKKPIEGLISIYACGI